MDKNTLKQRILSPDFFRRDGLTLAKDLLGKILVRHTPHGVTAGIISETEAYMGITDKASHAYGGRRTARTETMYLPGGHAYVYLIYGIYSCMNVTAAEAGNPEAVLIRGVVPIFGEEIMRRNYDNFGSRGKHLTDEKKRFQKSVCKLTDGPGKLCAAMGIDRSLNGLTLFDDGEIFLSDLGFSPCRGITESPRIGIAYAEEAALFPWRFTANPILEQWTTVQYDDAPSHSVQSKSF